MTFVSPVSRANGSTAPPTGSRNWVTSRPLHGGRRIHGNVKRRRSLSTDRRRVSRPHARGRYRQKLRGSCVCVCFRHRHQPTTPTDRPHTSADYGQMITGCQANEPVDTTWALTCPETVHPGVWSGGDAGDGVPPLFSTGGTRPPLSPTFLD